MESDQDKLQNVPMLAYRLRHGLTQTQAGKLVGLTQGDWSQLESLQVTERSRSAMNEIISSVASLLEVDESEITPSSFENPGLFTDLTREELDAVKSNVVSHDEVSDPTHGMDAVRLKSELHASLRGLTYRERETLKLRFGLHDGYTYTLKEVARIFKISRERVRQVEAKAIRKLQHPTRAKRLEGFLPPYRDCPSRRKISRVGEVIRSYIKKHGLSQARFADKTGVTKAMISRLVSWNNVQATEEILARLAKYWKEASLLDIYSV